MKKFLAALSVLLAFSAPVVFAQNVAPSAPAAPDAATLAAANAMLVSMNYRSVAQSMFGQMRQAMPTMMKQGAAASINNNPKLDAKQKQAALDKVSKDLPKAVAAIDGIFADPVVLDDMMQETAKLYARHFTVTELQQIAVFYKTPVGAKMLATMPQLTAESMQMSQRVVMPRIAAVMQKLQAAAPK